MAEAELEQNLNRTFKTFFRANDEVRGGHRGQEGLGMGEPGTAEVGSSPVALLGGWGWGVVGCGRVWGVL